MRKLKKNWFLVGFPEISMRVCKNPSMQVFWVETFSTQILPGPNFFKPSILGGLRIFRAFASLFLWLIFCLQQISCGKPGQRMTRVIVWKMNSIGRDEPTTLRPGWIVQLSTSEESEDAAACHLENLSFKKVFGTILGRCCCPSSSPPSSARPSPSHSPSSLSLLSS